MTIRVWSTDETDAGARGAAFGAAFAAGIRAALGEYDTVLRATAIDLASSRDVVEDCLAQSTEYAPDVVAEVTGIARGAGLEPWRVMLLSARTEVFALMKLAGSECSTGVFLPADGSAPRSIQTWDWLDVMSAATVVRRYPSAEGRQVVTFAEVGQVAKIGVNSAGLGLHFNILHHVSDGSRSGVPVHVVARRILDEATTLDEAVAVARLTPVAASSVLTVVAAQAGSPRAASIELTPAGVAVVEATPGRVLAHTNHFLDPGLAAGQVIPPASTTAERLACLTQHAPLVALPDPLERALALGALPDAPITMRPRADAPPHQRWSSKATLALDVEDPAIEFHPGGPADVTRAGWRRVPVADRTA